MAAPRVILEKSAIVDALTKRGTITGAAEELGCYRATLRREMDRYSIRIDEFDPVDLSGREDVDETSTDTGERRIVRGCRTIDEFLESIEGDLDRFDVAHTKSKLIPAYEKSEDQTTLVDYWMHEARLVPIKPDDPRALRDEVLEQLKAAAPKRPRQFRRNRRKGQTMALVGLFDFHLGMPGWLDLAEETFCRVVEDAIAATADQNVGCYLLLLGNDFLHFDGNDKRTNVHYVKGGTPQDTAEVGYLELRQRALELFRWAIDRLKAEAQVRIAWVPGNHDWMSSLSLFDCVRCIYENDAGVEFVEPNEEGRAVVEWGGTRLLCAHGDKVRGKQMSQNLLGFARDAFIGSSYFEILTGHHHNEMVMHESNGVVWRQLGSAGGHGRWASTYGFLGARQMAQTIVYSEHEGPVLIVPHHLPAIIRQLEKAA